MPILRSSVLSSKSEDISILYDLFKSVGKTIQVDDLKKQFYSVFLKEDKNANQLLIEARFWDSITTLQYLGFLSLDDNNEKAVKLMLKTWLKDAEIKDVGAYFAVSDAKSEIGAWDSSLRVSSRGYMLGYNDLKGPSVSGFFRFLARVGDGMMRMQIVKIKFRGESDEASAL